MVHVGVRQGFDDTLFLPETQETNVGISVQQAEVES